MAETMVDASYWLKPQIIVFFVGNKTVVRLGAFWVFTDALQFAAMVLGRASLFYELYIVDDYEEPFGG